MTQPPVNEPDQPYPGPAEPSWGPYPPGAGQPYPPAGQPYPAGQPVPAAGQTPYYPAPPPFGEPPPGPLAPEDLAGPPPQATPVGHAGTRVQIEERQAWHVGGAAAAPLLLARIALFLFALGLFASAAANGNSGIIVLAVVLLIAVVLFYPNMSLIQPGTTRVVQFFAKYVGTVRRTGLVFSAPLTTTSKVSVRVNNFETAELKVNDAEGNPVNIAAIVVWQVADTAKSKFAVEDYRNFVEVQAEAALRHVTGIYPYDNPDSDGFTLRGSTDRISAEIAEEVAARVALAGIEVIEARISKLAYAPEIAQAMLQRQQAGAIIAARERIVEGAVTMVEGALKRLDEEGIVELDDERKAAMVSNLLVVLVGESRATPIVNAGSLYH